MMIFQIGCVKTKTIYETEIKECAIKEPKFINIDPELTSIVPVPYWEPVQKPKYIDLKELYIETKEALRFCNDKLKEIEKLQKTTIEKKL